VELKDIQSHRLKQLEQQVKELQQVVGQKLMSIDYLEKGRSSSSRVWHRSKKKTSIPHLLLVPRPQVTFDQELAGLVALADLLKAEHPGCGVDKLHYTLKPERMGSDTFCELFLGLGYGVQRVKN